MSDAVYIRAHQEWLGYVQPVGLVVSPTALVTRGVLPDKNVAEAQRIFQSLVLPEGQEKAQCPDFSQLAAALLDWDSELLCEAPESLSVALTDYDDLLKPRWAFSNRAGGWLLLVMDCPLDLPFDEIQKTGEGWRASPAARLERLLRETEIPIGLLHNGRALRLCYAPRGESSGHLDFDFQSMTEVAGRPILAAFLMLLRAQRLLGGSPESRLPALLEESRRFQNEVTTSLAGQVFGVLTRLLGGFEVADRLSGGRVLGALPTEDPQHVYGGLLTALMRVVFLLYAEERGLMSADELYVRHYSVTGLYEQLVEDAALYADTMDQRYGAWARLVTLFRMVHDGGRHGAMSLPSRQGELFNPDRFPFLEGRPKDSHRSRGEVLEVPKVSDGVVYELLQGLLVLGGERLSYRALDVEHIGSVYEAMMGYELKVARGPSVAVRSQSSKDRHARVVIDLAELLAEPGARRKAWLKREANCELTGTADDDLKNAASVEDLERALRRRVSSSTEGVLPAGSLFLQPGEERRRSGSHYTPRALTEPIVRKTLRPVLERLGPHPRPEEILELKICDPAMGSGAFLVEACRQLAEALLESWSFHKAWPELAEDPLLHARRLVAQRCLYGVDKNPFAVSLARLSLWLVTLARDQAFAFLDHALKCGDSLVGLSRKQIEAMDWEAGARPKAVPKGRGKKAAVHKDQMVFEFFSEDMRLAQENRRGLLDQGDAADAAKWGLFKTIEDALYRPRLVGDLIISAFFSADKDKARRERLTLLQKSLMNSLKTGAGWRELEEVVREAREGSQGLRPLHWEIEFPEVFGRENPGFDVFVGNPPFAGKNTTISSYCDGILDWFKFIHEETHGNSDLVAHFFRRGFKLLRVGGTLGLIATNTIGQGDTRSTGLRWICLNGGVIYEATRRMKWPGMAAVVVSVVHISKGVEPTEKVLDGKKVERITAFLFPSGGHENPATLHENAGKSFQGSIVLGMGFTFDETDSKGQASSLVELERLIAKDPRNAERIFPYIGGKELNSSPIHAHHRYVINFGEMSEEEARQWPDLMSIVEERVKPERMKNNREGYRRYWWQFGEKRVDLYRAIAGMERVLACCLVSNKIHFAFLPAPIVYSHKLAIFPFSQYQAFSILQANVHEVWGRFFSSTMKDDINYSPSDCFETFPFPNDWESNTTLEKAGQAYYDYRADFMVRCNEGMTDIYNRFHNPDEDSADIQRLRALHEAMDKAVLSAYGWDNIPTSCEFLLDYEDEDEDSNSRRKKPWRYRWPDEVRDEVLGRLLELNARRARGE